MRNINDDKGNFVTKGNTNGVYNHMQRMVTEESKVRFKQKPWYMIASKQSKNEEN